MFRSLYFSVLGIKNPRFINQQNKLIVKNCQVLDFIHLLTEVCMFVWDKKKSAKQFGPLHTNEKTENPQGIMMFAGSFHLVPTIIIYSY